MASDLYEASTPVFIQPNASPVEVSAVGDGCGVYCCSYWVMSICGLFRQGRILKRQIRKGRGPRGIVDTVVVKKIVCIRLEFFLGIPMSPQNNKRLTAG